RIRHTGIPAFRYSDIPIFRHSDIPIFRAVFFTPSVVSRQSRSTHLYRVSGNSRSARSRQPAMEATMRFMLIVKASEDTEAGVLPSSEQLNEMGKFNEEMVKAGILLAGEGLHASARGARVLFKGKQRTVIDGPFAESKELIAGFWLVDVSSREEAIEWVKRIPNPTGDESEIEIRQVIELEEFGDAVTEEIQERQDRLHASVEERRTAATGD